MRALVGVMFSNVTTIRINSARPRQRAVAFARAHPAYPVVNRLVRDRLDADVQLVPGGPGSFDIDEGIFAVDGAGGRVADGFHPCFP